MKILVTGAFGQIGVELTEALRRRHGRENVLATGRRAPPADSPLAGQNPVEQLDVTDREAVEQLIGRHGISVIYHLAAKLSAVGEHDPQAAWKVNMDGLLHVLEAARVRGVSQVFWPSSIAAFGPEAPRDQTPQETVMRPTTMYGITKLTGELLADYYASKYGLDVRSVRLPGVISSEAPPGGGTTDYAVEIFHAAVRGETYVCFVREDTVLPMIYMPDCIRAILELMAADREQLHRRNAFNLAAMSFYAGELAAEIKKHIPGFTCTFQPDERQAIADSWPRSLDDSAARQQWKWRPEYDLARTTIDMLKKLRAKKLANS